MIENDFSSEIQRIIISDLERVSKNKRDFIKRWKSLVFITLNDDMF